MKKFDLHHIHKLYEETKRNGRYIVKGRDGRERYEWYKDGMLHRDEDEPAVEYLYDDEEKRWFKNGVLHRDNGPASVYDDGEEWFQKGKLHRVDGPAIIHVNGDGTTEQIWAQNNEYHRLDGPAVVAPNVQYWYIKGTKYKNIYVWAKAALEYQKLPSDDGAVKQYIQKVLNNITDEEI